MTTRSVVLLLSAFVVSNLAFGESSTKITVQPTPFEGRRANTLMDAGGNIHLVFNQQGNVFYSRLKSGGKEFSSPIQVNTVDKCAAVADLAVGEDGRVHVLFHGNIFYIRDRIKSEGRRLQGSDIQYTFYSRMNDSGDGFEEQRNVSGNVWGFDGGCAIAADGAGNVYAFINGTTRPGNELVRDIYMIHSTDGGKTFADPRAVGSGEGVCACCHLNATVNRRGELMFVYRVAENRMNRDSYVFTSVDGGKTFQRKRLDHWELNACPGTVYSFAEAEGETFVSWRTQDQVYLGVPGLDQPVVPGESGMKRRAAAIGSNAKGEILMAWAEGENFNKPHDMAWQLFDSKGEPVGSEGRKENAFARWGNPSIYADDSGDFVILH